MAALVGGNTSYEVKAGDTLGSIAARFGVARAALIEMNALTSPYALRPGGDRRYDFALTRFGSECDTNIDSTMLTALTTSAPRNAATKPST